MSKTSSRPSPDLPKLVSLTGAGRILGGVSKQYVHRLAVRGELIGTRLDGDGAWAFREDYVREYAKALGKDPAE